jgi:hypothetical protein
MRRSADVHGADWPRTMSCQTSKLLRAVRRAPSGPEVYDLLGSPAHLTERRSSRRKKIRQSRGVREIGMARKPAARSRKDSPAADLSDLGAGADAARRRAVDESDQIDHLVLGRRFAGERDAPVRPDAAPSHAIILR